MKNLITKIILTLLLIQFTAVSCQTNKEPELVLGKDESEEELITKLPLIYHMAYFQRFSEKLYFSGMEENWELADIYDHELEELAELIVEAEDNDENINRSKLMNDLFLPQLKKMEVIINNKDWAAFKDQYKILIESCNRCHDAANYGAINITIPNKNPYNQNFSREKEE